MSWRVFNCVFVGVVFYIIAKESPRYISFRQILDNIMDESEWLNRQWQSRSVWEHFVKLYIEANVSTNHASHLQYLTNMHKLTHYHCLQFKSRVFFQTPSASAPFYHKESTFSSFIFDPRGVWARDLLHHIPMRVNQFSSARQRSVNIHITSQWSSTKTSLCCVGGEVL